MPALVLAVAVLAAFGASGVALLRHFAPSLDPLERIAYGVPLGNVVASLALLSLACAIGFRVGLILAVAACGAASLLARSPAPRWPRFARPRGAALLSIAVLAAFGLRWLWFWSGAMSVDASGLWAAQRSLWADGAQHLGDIASFAYGDNFPPLHPRFPGHAFNYHYLTSITTAALVKIGVAPWTALCLHGFVLSLFVALAVFVFARRLGLGHGAAATSLILLVLGGGLAWWPTLHRIAIGGGAAPLWDYAALEAANFRWLNVYFALIAPQRALLYGLPLGLLTLRLLFVGAEVRSLRVFVAAGVVAGLLPFAHLGTLLALALLTPCLALAFPMRGWLGFFGTWALLAGPQLLAQQGGSAGAAGAFRWLPGWVAPPEPWAGFWLRNLGLFLPLLLASFAIPADLPPRARRFLLAFQPLFVVSNLFAFQPWDWDNTKILLWWYLASCLLVSGILSRSWRLRPAALWRPLVVAAVLSLTLSGLLENLDQALGRQRSLLLSAEEIELARRVREGTDPHALFAVGLQHNHPVPVLSGRRVVMSFPPWLWSQGIDSSRRERELTAIMTLRPDAASLIDRLGVAYVVVGPDEERRFGADPEAWSARYPCVIRTEHYRVYRVRP